MSEAPTPARVRDIHREQLTKLEQERGDKFWVLGIHDRSDLGRRPGFLNSIQMRILRSIRVTHAHIQ